MEALQTLITEKSKDVALNLSSLFEGLDLAEEVQENLTLTFETAVKTAQIQLAESVLAERELALQEQHLQEMLAQEQEIEEKYKANQDALAESVDMYITDYLKEWKEQNQLAIDNQLKAKLFDQIFESLQNVFVEHNLNVPTEQVDIMEELQEDNDELQEKVDQLMRENKKLQTELTETKVKETIKRLTEGLTVSQIEKVMTLSESIQIDEHLEKKLSTIIKMVEATDKAKKEDEKEPENDEKGDEKAPEEIKEGLNYTDPSVVNQDKPAVNPQIAQYLKYAR